MALPNPFQNATLPSPILNAIPKSDTQNDTILLQGYRSNFDINQQKAAYQQRMRQQQQQPPGKNLRFNRTASFKNNRTENINDNNLSANHNWCNLCECNFKYPQQLQKHQDEHEKCWFDNCNFEGSSILLQRHIETQHQSDLFQRIEKIETDEDIEKWRAERKKRYPTAANIEARRLAQEERLKRGERIQEPNHRFGNMKNRKSAQQRSNQIDSVKQLATKKNDRKRRRIRNNKKSDEKNLNDTTEPKTTTIILTTTTTTAAAATVESVKSSTSTTEQCPVKLKEKTVPITNALSAIMGMYGSDTDSDCDDDTTMSVTMDKQEEQVNNITEHVTAASDPISTAVESNEYNNVKSIENKHRKRAASTEEDLLSIKQLKIDPSMPIERINQQPEHESDDDDLPVEQPIQRQLNIGQQTPDDNASGPTNVQCQSEKNINKKKTFDSKTLTNDKIPKKKTILNMTRNIRNQNTLLEKLLQKDIRHERNVLLQCVRYVVENNFFGIGQKKQENKNK